MYPPPINAPSIAVILGSSFHSATFQKWELVETPFKTPFGSTVLHRVPLQNKVAWVLFRHGSPHRFLPNQINYRANAYALKMVNCQALLITSSVGVMTTDLPLYKILFLKDLLYPENRLPDGNTCTMFPHPTPQQGHLVLNEGLFSKALTLQLIQHFTPLQSEIFMNVTFAYAGGPRTKTPAENRYWAAMGAQVNSMTLAPEVVLANELEIPCAGLVVGHKYSVPDVQNPPDGSIQETLDTARERLENAVQWFIEEGTPVPFRNHLFRF
ncbi:MAG: 5'-methylthioadenosine phosphorylase [Bacteroidetes Order II. Incertae sedis bacterium]|nr:5'-methylthioadenosine phosphorylase [Bacteroidetes Order II. bacterium]